MVGLNLILVTRICLLYPKITHKPLQNNLVFIDLAHRQREGGWSNDRNVDFKNSLRWPIYMINSVAKTKLFCNIPQRRSTTVSLESFFLYALAIS